MNNKESQEGQYSTGTPIKMINDRQMRVLIADDSKLLRKKLRDELEKLGCAVVEAANGKEAVAYDLEHEPDGIILDIVMPEVGGIEALQTLREVSPDVPVVMLSSAGTPQKLMQTLKMGAIDFIQKPYTHEQIVHAVETIRRIRIKNLKKAEEEAEKLQDFDEGGEE
jgi:DNA-binding NtrC family response regulator